MTLVLAYLQPTTIAQDSTQTILYQNYAHSALVLQTSQSVNAVTNIVDICVALRNAVNKGYNLRQRNDYNGNDLGLFTLESVDSSGNKSNIFTYDPVTTTFSFSPNVTVSIPKGVADVFATSDYVNSQISQLNTTLQAWVLGLTWTSSQITDFSNAVKATNVTDLEKPNKSFDANSQKIVNLTAGSSNTDGVNVLQMTAGDNDTLFSAQSYVDNKNITLTGAVTGSSTLGNSLTTTLTSRLDQVPAPESTVSMSGYRMTSLGNGSLTTDAATMSQVGSGSSSPSTLLMIGAVKTGYNSNVSAGDHVKFDTVFCNYGNSIYLDTSTPYTTAIGTSIGRISLPPGRRYKLEGYLNNLPPNPGNGYNTFQWWCLVPHNPLGYVANAGIGISSRSPSTVIGTFDTTNGQYATVELRIVNWSLSSSGIYGTNDAVGPIQFCIQTF